MLTPEPKQTDKVPDFKDFVGLQKSRQEAVPKEIYEKSDFYSGNKQNRTQERREKVKAFSRRFVIVQFRLLPPKIRSNRKI